MAGVDKRGQLSPGLLIAKNGDGPTARRGALKLASDADAAPAEPPETAESAAPEGAILYGKGDASASTFRPSYWSYDRKPDGGATVTPISPAIVGKLTVEPARAPRAVARPKRRRSRRTPTVVVLTFG